MIRHKLLRLSSKDLSNKTDFKNTFSNVSDLGRTIGAVVKHVSFPNVFYNVTTVNNTLDWTVAGVPNSATITPGFYDITALLAAVDTALGPGNITTSQSSTTLRITFTNTTGSEYVLLSSSTLAPVLGISANLTLTTPGGTATTQNMPQLQGIQHVWLKSRVLSRGTNAVFQGTQQETGYVAMIPVKVAFGSVQHYESEDQTLDAVSFHSTDFNLTEIDIQLFDDEGNLLDLHGHDISIVLKVYYNI